MFKEASGVRQTFKSAEYSRSFVHCCVLVERWCVRRGLKSAWNGSVVSVVLLVVADALVVPRGMIPGRQFMKRHRKKIDTQKVPSLDSAAPVSRTLQCRGNRCFQHWRTSLKQTFLIPPPLQPSAHLRNQVPHLLAH